MRTKVFHVMLKLTAALLSILIIAMSIVQPVKAGDYNGSTEDWLSLSAAQHTGKVCPKQTLDLTYVINFNNSRYVTHTKWLGNEPQKSDSPPKVTLFGSQGKLWDHKKPTGAWDPVSNVWNGSFKLTVEKKGSADVRVEATYLGATAWDLYKITVSESCQMDVQIKADESGFLMPTGKTVNESQNSWSIRVFLDGLAKKVLADPLENEGGNGGEKRTLSNPIPVWDQDDVTGTIETFGDGIWLGNEPDLVCGTKGPLTCSGEFTVHPVAGDETIDFQIDMLSGQCSSFTVWCKGSEGGGESTIPPLSSLAFKMNAVIPWEGGSAHYIHMLPHGFTLDFLISAYPVEEGE
jgi:hypothetical protein